MCKQKYNYKNGPKYGTLSPHLNDNWIKVVIGLPLILFSQWINI